MLPNGFNEAIIGLDTSTDVFRIIYDKDKMQQILIDQDNMSETDAIEYLEYNVFNAYVGEGTPIYAYAGDHTKILELMSVL